MERQPVRAVALQHADRRTTGGLPRLRFGLGTVASSRTDAAWLATSILLALAAGVVFVALAVARWNSFETNAFDLAFFDQIIYNTSRGRWFETSFVEYNFAGQHLEPILLAFVPAYWLGAGPLVLTVTQATVAAAAAVPLYFLARRLELHPAIAAAAVAGYLTNPYLHRAVGFDFHPEVMATLPAFIGAWAVVAKHTRVAVVATLSLLLFKEDTVFLVMALAALMWIRGQRRPATITASVGAAYALLAVLAIMPLLRGGESSDLVDRYGYVLPDHAGGTFIEDTLLLPLRVLREVFEPRQLWTIALFVFASGLLALARPKLLLALVPALLLALLSNHASQRHLELHYAAELVPIAIVASLLAAAALSQRIDHRWVAAALVAPPLLATILMNPLGRSHGEPPTREHRLSVTEALARVPKDETIMVSAQSGLLPRLSQRIAAHEFPGGAKSAEWIVVDEFGARSSQSLDSGFDEALDDVRMNMELVYERDGVQVFRRTQ